MKGLALHQFTDLICTQPPIRPSDAVSLVGARFDEVENVAEQMSAVREGTRARLQRRLAGELDNIILMALRKEPNRRYASVEQLSDDLARHLAGLPVRAQPDTLAYRATKCVRRHRLGAIATVKPKGLPCWHNPSTRLPIEASASK